MTDGAATSVGTLDSDEVAESTDESGDTGTSYAAPKFGITE